MEGQSQNIYIFFLLLPWIWKPKSILWTSCLFLAAVVPIKSFQRLFSCFVWLSTWSVNPSLIHSQQKSCEISALLPKDHTEKQALHRYELHIHQTQVLQNYGCCLWFKMNKQTKPLEIQRNPPNLEQKCFRVIHNSRTRQVCGLFCRLLGWGREKRHLLICV